MVATLQAKDFVDQQSLAPSIPGCPKKRNSWNQLCVHRWLASGDRQADFVDWALAVEADYVHLCWEHGSPTPHQLLSEDLITSVRRHGLEIVLWHEERLEELVELVQLDVYGICTNTPDVLASILGRSASQCVRGTEAHRYSHIRT